MITVPTPLAVLIMLSAIVLVCMWIVIGVVVVRMIIAHRRKAKGRA